MPTTYNTPWIERVFIQAQGSGLARTIPNGTGTWTQTGVKLLRAPKDGLTITPNIPLTPVPWKTGTRSMQPGILGRKNASWSLNNLPIIPSGTAGSAPDAEALFAGIFGTAGNVGGSAVTYAFSDTAFLPFTLFGFRHGVATLTQRWAFGCIPKTASFTLNGNIFEMNCSGDAVYAADSDSFSGDDTIGKGGLTAVPTEPSNPTVVGAVQSSFTGSCIINNTDMALDVRTLNVTVNPGSSLIGDLFKDAYMNTPVGGAREVTCQVGIVDNDSTALVNIKKLAKAKTATDVTIIVGVIAGSIVTFNLKSVQLAVPEYKDEDAGMVMVNFGSSPAHGSAIANIDDLTIVFS